MIKTKTPTRLIPSILIDSFETTHRPLISMRHRFRLWQSVSALSVALISPRVTTNGLTSVLISRQQLNLSKKKFLRFELIRPRPKRPPITMRNRSQLPRSLRCQLFSTSCNEFPSIWQQIKGFVEDSDVLQEIKAAAERIKI